MCSSRNLRLTFLKQHYDALVSEEDECSYRNSRETFFLDDLFLVSSESNRHWGVKLELTSKENVLHRKSLSMGDNVWIQAYKESESDLKYIMSYESIITGISAQMITLLLHHDHELDLGAEHYAIEKRPVNVTIERYWKAWDALKYPCKKDRIYNLDQIFFEEIPISPIKPPLNVNFVNKDLDDSQKYAVGFALAQEKVCMIHGPPGTGKTSIIIEILHQLEREGKRVLICAPSNVAVDNILERMEKEGFCNMVRIGNCARINPNLLNHSLEVIYRNWFKKDLYKANRKRKKKNRVMNQREYSYSNKQSQKLLKNHNSNNSSNFKNKGIRKDSQTIMKRNQEIYFAEKFSQMNLSPMEDKNFFKPEREKINPNARANVKMIFEQMKFVLVTLASSSQVKENFDVIIIDESTQALEISTWIAIPLAKKAIIVGDIKQLPPTVFSNKKNARVLEFSLMERLLSRPKFADYQVFLTIQHRMNSKIIEWPSQTFYQGQIKSNAKVAQVTLDSISNFDSYPPIILFDFKNSHLKESISTSDFSFYNEHEAKFVIAYSKFLVQNGIKSSNIGVITPYKKQVKLIRSLLEKCSEIAVKTVDGFQGQDKEVIILSLVRSNMKQSIGFLVNLRRMNVAITRAKRHLAVFCDSSTLSSDETLATFISYMYQHAKVICIEDFHEELLDLKRRSKTRL